MAALEVGPGFTSFARALTEPAFDASTSFTSAHVQNLAEQLSTQPFAKPSISAPPAFQKLGYDQFRDIRFRTDQAIWRGEKLDFELQLLPMGWLFDVPVEIWLVDGGNAKRLTADKNLFSLGPLVGDVGPGAPYGFSGFRVHGPINRPDYFDEYLVFQGACYFRAVGRGQGYGLSARGLAIDTARPNGEEFPIFRAFWIEKPKPNARSITVHALLDSQSTTGAYRFDVEAGTVDGHRRDGDALPAPRALARRTVAAHEHVPARSRPSPHRPGLPSRCPRQRRPRHLQRIGRVHLAPTHQPQDAAGERLPGPQPEGLRPVPARRAPSRTTRIWRRATSAAPRCGSSRKGPGVRDTSS